MSVDLILKQIQDCTVPDLLNSTSVSGEVMQSILQAIHLILGQFEGATRATALSLAFGAVCAETDGGMVVVNNSDDGTSVHFIPTFEDKCRILHEIAGITHKSYLEDLKRTEAESELNAMPTSDRKM